MYKIYEVTEQHIEKLGKSVKKCVIQKEGLQFPFKNVTVWPELPIYAEIQPGYQVPPGYTVDEKDGKNINPKSGKPYKERTLVQGTNANGTAKSSLSQEDATSVRLARLEAKVFGTEAYNADEDFDGIKADEIPF